MRNKSDVINSIWPWYHKFIQVLCTVFSFNKYPNRTNKLLARNFDARKLLFSNLSFFFLSEPTIRTGILSACLLLPAGIVNQAESISTQISSERRTVLAVNNSLLAIINALLGRWRHRQANRNTQTVNHAFAILHQSQKVAGYTIQWTVRSR